MSFELNRESSFQYIQSMIQQGKLEKAISALVDLRVLDAVKAYELRLAEVESALVHYKQRVVELGSSLTEVDAQAKELTEIRAAVALHAEQKRKWTEMYFNLVLTGLDKWREDIAHAMSDLQNRNISKNYVHKNLSKLLLEISLVNNDGKDLLKKWELNINCL
jgi:chromosome segregation ATPase